MDYDSLTSAQRRAYDETVAGSHHREFELQVLTLNGSPVTSLTNAFLGGSIQGDVSRTPCEVLQADVLDEDFALDWTNGQHRQFKIRVTDARFVPDLDDWVERVVFTGPLWDFERKGPAVSLVAHGSELLAMGSVRSVFNRPRKTRATDVITDLLKAAGALARNLSIPRLGTLLPESVTIGIHRGKVKTKNAAAEQAKVTRLFRATQEDTYWPQAERIAQALDRELYPDGRGVFCMRAPQTRPIVEFTTTTLLSPVTERRPSDGEVTNTWLILGADPKGPKKRVTATVALPSSHPLSAQKLAWNSNPRQIIERIENKQIRTATAARALGARRRDAALREMIEYEVEALPIAAWLRPNALVSVPTSSGRATMRVRQWTLPLGPGANALVIGANRRQGRVPGSGGSRGPGGPAVNPGYALVSGHGHGAGFGLVKGGRR